MFIEGAIPGKFIEAAAGAAAQGTGAQTFFVGRVRPDSTEQSEVSRIEFTANKELAEENLRRIIAESKQKYSILDAEVWHSLGSVPTGKACFLVSVNGKHRMESFRALEYIVNEVKARCPIFGKEIMKDGNSQWKENSPTY